MNYWKITILITVFLISLFLRFYQLDKLPPGLILDEASEGYNAFSLLNTGKDRYGEPFPVLFRSFESFQAPLYTYLTIIPVYFFGNSIFSVHFISAVSGMILVLVTFFLLTGDKKINRALLSAFLVGISPWAVFFSRIGTEANLGVSLFSVSFLLFYLSLKNQNIFPLATFILGLSTHAYYSERLISVLFLGGFVWLFRSKLLFNKKLVFLGIIFFLLTQIPHLLISNSSAFTRRITEVNYFSEQFFQSNGGELKNLVFGKFLFIIREFLSQYTSYFSPRNLFFDPDPQGARSMPDLSVFYNWMLIPFIFGLRYLIIKRNLPLIRMLILLIILSPLSAALTKDPFYTLRTLVFFWAITIMIAFGLYSLLSIKFSFKVKIAILILILLVSLSKLYISYFVLLKFERSENYGFSYIELLGKIEQMKDKKFMVDTYKEVGAGIRFAYLMEYNPVELQKDLKEKLAGDYYGNFQFNEVYVLDNIEIRPIFWPKDICIDQVLVGDPLAISSQQVEEHHLTFLFDIKDTAGNVTLIAYSTNPNKACKI